MFERLAIEDIRRKMNEFGTRKEPFLFLIDFEMKKPLVIPLNQINTSEILFQFPSFSNYSIGSTSKTKIEMTAEYPSFEKYQKAFDVVMRNLRHGNSYLLNLTLPTQITLNVSLLDIFQRCNSMYKLWWKDNLIFFSPEAFIQIENGNISSFPMKGTIDASIANAEDVIMNDPKELAEHNTIVDLIRNDLSRVSENVEVKRFRYVDKVNTSKGSLLQVSSEITGKLPENYPSQIGDILFDLLPAGSISGAPKKKTIEVILDAEQYDRSYYTGVCGVFDGNKLESGVMIRYIENIDNHLWFKSGGGITVRSDCKKEYEELIEKVYVPVS
ncbi:MAG: aminodeoxychorismate synthase component I [Bacteroidales bacterium]